MSKGGGRTANATISGGIATKIAERIGATILDLPKGNVGISATKGGGAVLSPAGSNERLRVSRLDVANALNQFRASTRTGTSLAKGRGAVVLRSFPTTKAGSKDLLVRMSRAQLGDVARKAFGLSPGQKIPRTETLLRLATKQG